jgi:hypothetical protein
VRVAARFEGPPGFANGGYLAGLLAGERPARVTIRRPVPLETDLEFDGAELRGDELLATVERVERVDVGDAPRVSLAEARSAAEASPLAARHPFPRCFGCGPDHPSGLHCLPGPVGGGAWAVPWTPEDASPPFAWAALDCPSSAPIASPTGVPAYVLGRIEASVGAVAAGEPHVVVAWAGEADGRRRHSAVVMWGPDGERVAAARATWFAIQPPTATPPSAARGGGSPRSRSCSRRR